MGMFLGNEIVQTRLWIDPKAEQDSLNLDYKVTFPITVFDAVRARMDDEHSTTLREVLERINKELDRRQTILPAKPANFIVTYAGAPGEVGSIGISDDIPWDTSKQRNDRIPTERAVGQLLLKLGYLDNNGQPTNPASKVMWDDIIGKPKSYDGVGTNDDGFMTQWAVTLAVDEIKKLINDGDASIQASVSKFFDQLVAHENDQNNPHNVTVAQIGAVSAEEYEEHISADNPHNITAHTIGLGNVDNTSDLEKPISTATQEAIDGLRRLLNGIGQNVDNIDANNVTGIDYDRKTSKLTISFENGDALSTFIPINDTINNVTLDRKNRRLVITKISGEEKFVPLEDIFYKITGSTGSAITVEIDESRDGIKQVKASIRPGSITPEMLSQDVGTGGVVLTDSCITTVHIKDQSVTTEKIADTAITGDKIADRSIRGKHLFTSSIPDMILAVRNKDADPEWTKVIATMIADRTITAQQIADGAIGTSQLADKAVTNEKVAQLSISGDRLVINPRFMGTPTIAQRPEDDSSDSSVPDTQWVMNRLDQQVLRSKNIGDRIIRGKHLFTSARGDEVLLVPNPNVDPEWGKITTKYIAEAGINGDRLEDGSVTGKQLKDGAVTPAKLFTSTQPNQVMAVLQDPKTPVWTKITQDLLADGSVAERHLQDGSIGLGKLPTSQEDFMVVGVHAKGSTPKWTKIISTMIEDRSIVPRHIFTSSVANRVLAVQQADGNPLWTQIVGEMIADKVIQQDHIGDHQIVNRHLAEDIIEAKHIKPHSISGDKLVPRSVTGMELFSSPLPNMVLTVTNPYDHPHWSKITGDMLGDLNIGIDNLKASDIPYRVLGSTTPGKHPEYVQVDGNFIAGSSIDGHHLKKDITIPGKPSIAETPDMGADNSLIPNTHWVRTYVNGILGTGGGSSEITAPGVLSVLHSGDTPEYRKITKELMDDSSVGSDQLADSIQLRGLPTILRRPDASASDVAGDGSLIPDCQWVLDRIKDAVKNLSGGTDTPGGGTEWDDFDEWKEIRDTVVQETWSTNGEGEVDSDDADEIPDTFIKETWDSSGTGDIITTDPYELTYEQIKAIWDETTAGDNPGTSPSGNDWIEMAQDVINGIWDQNGEGDLTADEGEMDDSAVRSVWDSNGEGDTTAEKAEISQQTVEEIWNDGWTDPGEADLTPGPFPGEEGSTGDIPTPPTGNTGVATSLEGEGIVHHDHLADRIVNGRKLFTSLDPDVVLTVRKPDEDPEWSKITGKMIEPDAIKTEHVQDGAITEEKLDDALREKLNQHQGDIGDTPDHPVDLTKIADHSIAGRKLARNTQIPAQTTVEPQIEYEKKSLRNIIISHRTPRGGTNGDIWFKYY